MDVKDSFKKNLKTAKQGLEVSSNPTSLFDSLSTELKSEIESNKVLKFKSNLRETFRSIKEEYKPSYSNIFDIIPTPQTIEEEFIQEEIIETLESIEEKPNIEKNLILDAVESISKEQTLKPNEQIPENYTNTFSQPNSSQPNPDIKSLQKKLKFLEDWVSKISMAGPGGGSGSIIDIDTPITIVDGDYTMNRMDYCLFVDPSEKVYITLPPAHNQRKVVIKDISGHAQLTPIHINGTVEGDVDGAEIRVNYASLQLIYYGNSWWVI